ncbi:MAG TPA: AsmA-like C-terminal region-containing protein, partial [Candidatus Acidoferrales bacterium]|nr:AsmA-like C-terminal region-containing protein [Candidatus Acidoferrales bacterium]
AVIEADSKGALLGESQIGVGDDDAGVRLAANANWTAGLPFEASLTGSTAHLAELSTAVAALGLSAEAQPLRAEGSAFVRLNWKGSARPWLVSTLGTLALEDVTLSGGALRSPISVGSARLDYLPVQRRLQFSATKAFGTTWTGTARAATIAGPWEFALTADRLNPAALVRGFSNPPPENTSLLSRILPAQAASTLARERPAWPAWLRGEGKITALALDVGRLEFERVQGSITLGERQVVLEGAEGGLYGGRVRGEVRADFGEQPRYDVRTEFDGVSVGALSAVAISTRLCCSGAASGHVELTATGWDRDALFASLAGTGHAEVRSGALLTLDLPATIAERALRAGRTAPRAASGDFLLSAGRIQLEKFVFDLPSSFLEGSGSVSYRGEIDVKVFNTLPGGRPAASTHGVQITGTLAAPQIAPGKSPR